MRNIILLFAMLAFPLLLSANDFRVDLSGYWYNDRIDESLKIVDKGNYIIVSGFPNRYDKIYFERIDKSKFIDRKDNLLLVKDRDEIKLLLNHSNKSIQFRKVRNGARHHNNGRDNDRFDGNNYYDPYKEKTFNERNYENYDHSLFERGKYESKVTGTWKTYDGKNIAIIDTRDGIKAKFSGSEKWVEYDQDSNLLNEFTDKKGNKYRFINDRCDWIPSDKGKEIILLNKISSEVGY